MRRFSCVGFIFGVAPVLATLPALPKPNCSTRRLLNHQGGADAGNPTQKDRLERDDDAAGRGGWGSAINPSYGISSTGRGMELDLDIDVSKLTGLLGPVSYNAPAATQPARQTPYYSDLDDRQVEEPVKAIVEELSRPLFIAAPVFALAAFVRNYIIGVDKKKQAAKEVPSQLRPVRAGTQSDQRLARRPPAPERVISRALNLVNPTQTTKQDGQRVTRATAGGRQPLASDLSVGDKWARFDAVALLNMLGRAVAELAALVGLLQLVGTCVEYESGAKGYLADPRLRGFVEWVTALLPVFIGGPLQLLRFKMDMEWYLQTLRKPGWTPPPKAFPLIWTPLKLLQSLSFARVWRATGHDALNVPVGLFLAHAVLGDLWNRTFFGEKRVGFGLMVMLAFYAVLASTCYTFFTVDTVAGWMLLPTVIWVSVAAALNQSIWALNGREALYPRVQ